MPTKNIEQIAEEYNSAYKKITGRVVICGGTGCIAGGSKKVYQAFQEEMEKRKIGFCLQITKDCHENYLSFSGCRGFCAQGPLVSVGDIFYTKVKPADVPEIVEKTLLKGEVIDRLLYHNPANNQKAKTVADIPFYAQQERILLHDCGRINPEDINEYIAHGGYQQAKRAYTEMTDAEVCKEMIASGLRGRGGGGFPTGKKWDLTRVEPGPKKYVICNADEGDPGAFMDRSVMEGNPNAVLEGMMIAARAIGADEGYIYVRMEYPLAIERVRTAIKQAEALGLLGENIFGSGKNFKIHVMEGAGAFVCGEETALIASVEGKRGMPKIKPPFPSQCGLFGKPTVINNVETLATVAKVLEMGAEAFRKIGTLGSPGTKTFAVTGHIANTGLVEVPMGTTLRQVIDDVAGGTTNDDGTVNKAAFKAAQIGGPSGGCLTREHLDLPLDFDSLKSVGAMVGSGGLVVMNDKTCMVNVARFFLEFTQRESCGKCVPCREGTEQMLTMLNDIVEGRATLKTLENLEDLAKAVQKASLCALGKTAPNPVLSTLKHFKEEYLAHVVDKRCPAGVCKALARFEIRENKCKGCGMCKRACPVQAISGEVGKPHHIDPKKCIKCGGCKSTCKFGAVVTGA
ncbi:NADH-ubiquinone oxidoreductase-F iron-sulfur binding region domain-containing protein [Candidatus Avelusimicrobium fimicolum]|uniref:NADH-ubiquinone oxidoreductase-F iron-sulfur binding region domain-containing protein n=1 Tax=Candidatus Avelusimicrobium fimicolum TaxID=3416216 RepID=UPI0015B16F11|nr:NADH-ubiquinone oxidoreductase-F iron-sulfur binding region domain-containing protein [Elusimicrobiaceae bacterium]